MEFVIFAVLLYFMPTIVAMVLREDPLVIFLVNLFLGWTVIGWFAALFWAVAARNELQIRQVRTVPASSGRFCSHCGAVAPPGTQVCANCGRAV
jgi:hypothetical protein